MKVTKFFTSFLFFSLLVPQLFALSSRVQAQSYRQELVTASSFMLLQQIPDVFMEDFGKPQPGFRFKIKNVKINNQGNVITVSKGGEIPVTMELLHDSTSCANAVNQVIVGIGGEERAQLSVWNGKQRTGGTLKSVNPGTPVQALAEDNSGPTEWVRV